MICLSGDKKNLDPDFKQIKYNSRAACIDISILRIPTPIATPVKTQGNIIQSAGVRTCADYVSILLNSQRWDCHS